MYVVRPNPVGAVKICKIEHSIQPNSLTTDGFIVFLHKLLSLASPFCVLKHVLFLFYFYIFDFVVLTRIITWCQRDKSAINKTRQIIE